MRLAEVDADARQHDFQVGSWGATTQYGGHDQAIERSGSFIACFVMAIRLEASVETKSVRQGNQYGSGNLENVNGKLRDEHTNGKIFCSLSRHRVVTRR